MELKDLSITEIVILGSISLIGILLGIFPNYLMYIL